MHRFGAEIGRRGEVMRAKDAQPQASSYCPETVAGSPSNGRFQLPLDYERKRLEHIRCPLMALHVGKPCESLLWHIPSPSPPAKTEVMNSLDVI